MRQMGKVLDRYHYEIGKDKTGKTYQWVYFDGGETFYDVGYPTSEAAYEAMERDAKFHMQNPVREENESKVEPRTMNLTEWNNSVNRKYDDRGTVMPQPEGETIDLSLRRYLGANPMPVKLSEDQLLQEYRLYKRLQEKES